MAICCAMLDSCYGKPALGGLHTAKGDWPLRFAVGFETRTPPMGGVLSNSAVGTALLSALAGLLIWLLRLLPRSLLLFAGLLTLLARRAALPALLRLGLVVLIGHLNLPK